MKQATIDRRTAENQVAFRNKNEQVFRNLAVLRQTAMEERYVLDYLPGSVMLKFQCECSDENCHRRISLSLQNYAVIHKNRNHFTICLHHELPSIEFIFVAHTKYIVVEKFIPPKSEVQPMFHAGLNNHATI